MKKGLLLIAGVLLTYNIQADQTGDCVAGTQYCEQNSLGTTNTTTTTNTNTNNNTNNNTNTNTNTNNNTNNNTSNNTNTNSNTNVNTTTSTANSTVNSTVSQTTSNTNSNNNINNNTSTNTNNNNSNSTSNVTTANSNNNTNTNNSTNNNNNTSTSTQTVKQEVKSPPASAIAPSIMSYSQDLCTTGVSGAFQGQLFGFSGGKAVRDENCERLKLSKYLYDTGMKVAAVAILCQDPRVFKAMGNAGTPCPYKGKIGEEAKIAWASNVEETPTYKEDLKSYIDKCTRTRNLKGISKSSRTCKKEFHSKSS
tara:strand:+ start:1451 stop:2377 length:927 start_codon:yes stop_codon:yes gene_type:complete